MTSDPSEPGRSPKSPRRTRRASFLFDVVPALGWTALVFVLGGIPGAAPPVETGFPIDKVEHALAFGVLQLLALRALRYELPTLSGRLLPWLAALCSTAAGGALELYQLAIPYRSAEFADLAADAVGAGLAAVVTTLLYRER